MNLLEATNNLRDAIAKYCAIHHNQPVVVSDDHRQDQDDRIDAAELRLDAALRETHHLQPGEGIEEIGVRSDAILIVTDSGRVFTLDRNTRYIA